MKQNDLNFLDMFVERLRRDRKPLAAKAISDILEEYKTLSIRVSNLESASRLAREEFADLNGEVTKSTWDRLYLVTRELDKALANKHENGGRKNA